MDKPMTWTAEPPKKTGFYWVKQDDQKLVVHVFVNSNIPGQDPLAWYCGIEQAQPILHFKGCRWFGPIDAPPD